MPRFQLLKNDNYETLYVDGKQVASAHTLDAEDVVAAITGEQVETVDESDLDDDKITNEGGNVYYDGELIWENGKGHPSEWPFEDDDAEAPAENGDEPAPQLLSGRAMELLDKVCAAYWAYAAADERSYEEREAKKVVDFELAQLAVELRADGIAGVGE
ncbi:MAG: hypothetical protein ACAH17_01595 [Candidatus Paceibacterota bacterium]